MNTFLRDKEHFRSNHSIEDQKVFLNHRGLLIYLNLRRGYLVIKK